MNPTVSNMVWKSIQALPHGNQLLGIAHVNRDGSLLHYYFSKQIDKVTFAAMSATLFESLTILINLMHFKQSDRIGIHLKENQFILQNISSDQILILILAKTTFLSNNQINHLITVIKQNFGF